jgi:pyridoxamine 5'-phosphate oxidase
MALATSTPDGRPSARMVLLKGVEAGGFVFYTNYDSRKAAEIEGTQRAALLFYWPTFERQVRVEGAVARVSAAESDEYFAARPLESRWSARGVAAEPAGCGASGARGDVARVRDRSWRGRAAAAVLGRLPGVARRVRVLAGRENRLHDRLAYTLTAGGWRRSASPREYVRAGRAAPA